MSPFTSLPAQPGGGLLNMPSDEDNYSRSR